MAKWRLGKTGSEQRMILDDNDRYVCSVQIYQTPQHMGEYDEARRLANVPLILCAPEMAEMLLSMFVHVSHGGPTRAEAEALLKKAGVIE